MKRMILIMTLAAVFAATASADDKPVPYKKLPADAKAYIEKNFSKADVTAVMKDDDILYPDYDVIMSDGTKLEFSSSGSLKKVASYKAIPSELIPVSIREYVQAHYPGAIYKEYEIGRWTYEVTLDNRLELTFNSDFSIIELDD